MNITKAELKHIIKEELQLHLQENLLTDIISKIKQSGEDAATWLKTNTQAVAQAAMAADVELEALEDRILTMMGAGSAVGSSSPMHRQ